MRWTHQKMYVARDDNGVIVRIQADRPPNYRSPYEKSLDRAHRTSSDDVEASITEYAKKKQAEKRKWMGD